NYDRENSVLSYFSPLAQCPKFAKPLTTNLDFIGVVNTSGIAEMMMQTNLKNSSNKSNKP
ncbi:MAG: hypothetical protein KKB30_02045, partial [Proteobacteria bacterium]|nr:hypothetical protein [Pseudomonadota bacterium]MBU1714678.1 hypothetical protein [Pseudomonadota bacterium]